jgi:bifunctional NMN adenylyltransferase/nudix hydrolase
MKIGFVVGRFQAPYLHEGYLYLFKRVLEEADSFAIVLSKPPIPPSKRNPFTIEERQEFLKKQIRENSLYKNFAGFCKINDNRYDDVWSQELDDSILAFCESHNAEPILFGSRDSFIPYYSGNIKVIEVEPLNDTSSSTEVRKKFVDNIYQVGYSYFNQLPYLAGKLTALYAQYPKVYSTVDVAILNEDSTQLLLGRKPGERAWRFPGGFVDPTDECKENAVRREAYEECGGIEIGDIRYICSQRINDWRYKSEEDKIMTTFFAAKYVFGSPHGSDDLEEVKWFNIEEIQLGDLSPSHQVLFTKLIEYLDK